MDARTNVVLRAIALRTDIEEITDEASQGVGASESGGGMCPCQVGLGRLAYVKPQLAALRRRSAGDPPAEVEEASKALGAAEKRLAQQCRRGGPPREAGARMVREVA